MNFWDASAIFPLYIDEESTPEILHLRDQCDSITIWTLTPVEVVSALFRLQRMGKSSTEVIDKSVRRALEMESAFQIIEDVEMVKLKAARVLRLHPLKAADALQLAAALVALSDDDSHYTFVTLDKRLSEAAAKEGFLVLPQ